MTFILWLSIGLTGVCLWLLLCEDWWRWTRARRRVAATVIDHRRQIEDGGVVFRPELRFVSDDGRRIEFFDMILNATATPPVGTVVEVVYPVGLPEKAWVPRPVLRAIIHLFVLGLLAILLARVCGFLAA